jgi:hypothetical protein
MRRCGVRWGGGSCWFSKSATTAVTASRSSSNEVVWGRCMQQQRQQREGGSTVHEPKSLQAQGSGYGRWQTCVDQHGQLSRVDCSCCCVTALAGC